MKILHTTRYVTPLREGGSVPAIVEADDDGLYVVKMRGAGSGIKALIAEVIAGEMGRSLGLRIPELALIELDAAIGRAEPDAEIRDLLKASVGLNVAMDYLPGSLTFDPLAEKPVNSKEASDVVWFDALITNVDRTAKNPNLLCWHRKLWLIDHGAALYFHHDWDGFLKRAQTPFPPIAEHVLLPFASELEESAKRLSPLVLSAVEGALAQVPDAWLTGEAQFSTPADHRSAYRDYFRARLDASSVFLAEALRAQSKLI